MAHPDGEAVAAGQAAHGFHAFVDDGKITGVKQADKVLHAPEVVARMTEEAFHTVGNGEAAPGNETFPDNVGYEGIAGWRDSGGDGRKVGDALKAADKVKGRPIVVAQAAGADIHGNPAPVAAKGADTARKRVLLSGMERINVGTEQRLIVGVNRFVSFFDGEALVGAGKAGITGKNTVCIRRGGLFPDDFG